MSGPFIFFLGGHDLEMVTVAELLREEGISFYDKGLRWGAKTSAYREEVEQCLAQGLTPVLVELTDDIRLDQKKVVILDPHGDKAGADKPTALHQVFAILK